MIAPLADLGLSSDSELSTDDEPPRSLAAPRVAVSLPDVGIDTPDGAAEGKPKRQSIATRIKHRVDLLQAQVKHLALAGPVQQLSFLPMVSLIHRRPPVWDGTAALQCSVISPVAAIRRGTTGSLAVKSCQVLAVSHFQPLVLSPSIHTDPNSPAPPATAGRHGESDATHEGGASHG